MFEVMGRKEETERENRRERHRDMSGSKGKMTEGILLSTWY